MIKDTEELMTMLQKSKDIITYIEENHNDLKILTFTDYLDLFLEKYQMSKAEVINRSGINQIYGYQIFAGTKKPSRDKIITLISGYHLSIEDGNLLLKSANLSPLYIREKRDAVIMYGLINKLDIFKIDELLYELGLETINK